MTMIIVPAMIAQVVSLLFMDKIGIFIKEISGNQVLGVFITLLAVLDAILFPQKSPAFSVHGCIWTKYRSHHINRIEEKGVPIPCKGR